MKLLRHVFIAFSVLYIILIFAIWSNVCIYAEAQAQQQQLSSRPARAIDSGSSLNKPISAELKTKMCDPSNPSLKIVNTTEARICGIPKTVKPPLQSSSSSAAAAMPSTSGVLSSTPSSQLLPTTKLLPAGKSSTPTPKQHIIAIKNNTNSSSLPTSSLSLSLSSGLAPQVKAVNQKQQSLTTINDTARQNHAFVATYPTASAGKLLNSSHHNSTVSLIHDNSVPKLSSSTSQRSSESIESFIKNHIDSIVKDSIRHKERTR